MGRDWQSKDREALAHSIDNAYRIVGNQRRLKNYVSGPKVDPLIDDSEQRALGIIEKLSGAAVRLFRRDVDEIERRKRSAGR